MQKAGGRSDGIDIMQRIFVLHNFANTLTNELPEGRKMKALQLMMREGGTGKGAIFLPNLIVEKVSMVHAGTSDIVTRTDVDTGDRPQTTGSETDRNLDSSVNLTILVLLFRIIEETRRDRKCYSNGSRRCVIKISASPASGLVSSYVSRISTCFSSPEGLNSDFCF